MNVSLVDAFMLFVCYGYISDLHNQSTKLAQLVMYCTVEYVAVNMLGRS